MLRGFITLLAAAFLALVPGAFLHAQNSVSNSTGTVFGPPQLKDFQLTPRERIVTQAPPAAEVQPEPAPSPPPVEENADRPAERSPARASPASPVASAPAPVARQDNAPADSVPAVTAQETGQASAPPLPAESLPVLTDSDTPPVSPPPAPADAQGSSYWLYALPVFALALFGFAAYRFRRNGNAPIQAAESSAVPLPAPMPAPRPEAVLRPWLDLDVVVKRVSVAPDEAEVDFELTIRNTGKDQARNVRINACLFNAGANQDKEIGAYFNTRGEGRRTFAIPAIEPGMDGIIPGTVTMASELMNGIIIEGRTLFIPMLAVNILYDWGEARTGQTSKSYVVGRKPEVPKGKMGPFRLDLGPRVWRSVDQRHHRLARRT